MEITQQQSRKRRKRSHKEQNKPSIDRLSSLPDSVLCRILSRLSTKHSVATSILSRRWRYLWADVPNLYFTNREGQETINRFMLLSKVQSIHTFCLFCWFDCSAYQLQTWVTFSIMRNVIRLDLCFLSELPQIDLPRCLFTCKTLVYLGLKCCGFIPMSGTVCLPRLKILRLIDVGYEADESLPHLISGCPVLEDLSIDSNGLVRCKVSSPTIKRLTIHLFYSMHRLEINTPAVRYLEINDISSGHIESGPLNALVEAEVSLRNDEKGQHDVLYPRSVLDFIDRFCHVIKELLLGFAYCTKPEIIDSLLSHWTLSFPNLIELELRGDCRILSKMLENAKNLEFLVFNEMFRDEVSRWREPPQVPKCLSSHLRIIKLVDIIGDKSELEMIRYLLSNSLVLKKMIIAYHELIESEEKINMLQEISLFPRGSTACEVAFVAAET